MIEKTLPSTPDQTILPSWFSRSLIARLLSSVYGMVLSTRNFLYDRLPFLSGKAPRPVISIGGIRMGGTGKTPAALLVARYLQSKNRSVAFLSRGYGRNGNRLRIVNPGEEVSWDLIGDEPWLLHDRLPESWLGIHPDRRKSAGELARTIPQQSVFVMDDGFQHRALRRDLDIVCLNTPPEKDRLFPAGNLREGTAALRRAQIVLLIGRAGNPERIENQSSELLRRFPHLKVFTLVQQPGSWVCAADGRTAGKPPLERPLLVCGIARPERFIEMVRDAEITPGETIIVPDHHQYIANDFNKTRELYSNGVITTEKDAVRLKKLKVVPDKTLWYLTIELVFKNKAQEKEFYPLIEKYIS
jgi:tetraacyldisaccharide 4'-kinase